MANQNYGEGLNYANADVLRDEVEAMINARASNAEILNALPLTPDRLLEIIRLLVDELADPE